MCLGLTHLLKTRTSITSPYTSSSNQAPPRPRQANYRNHNQAMQQSHIARQQHHGHGHGQGFAQQQAAGAFGPPAGAGGIGM